MVKVRIGRQRDNFVFSLFLLKNLTFAVIRVHTRVGVGSSQNAGPGAGVTADLDPPSQIWTPPPQKKTFLFPNLF